MKYIGKQLQCKHKVPTSEWSVALDSFPRLSDWLKTVNLRRQVTQVCITARQTRGLFLCCGIGDGIAARFTAVLLCEGALLRAI